jgi:hypothetical protein
MKRKEEGPNFKDQVMDSCRHCSLPAEHQCTAPTEPRLLSAGFPAVETTTTTTEGSSPNEARRCG